MPGRNAITDARRRSYAVSRTYTWSPLGGAKALTTFSMHSFHSLKPPSIRPMLNPGDGATDEGHRLRGRTSAKPGRVVVARVQAIGVVRRCFALAELLVFPTHDACWMVVEEAMAYSLPFISTDPTGEIRTQGDDGDNGYTVPSQDLATPRLNRVATRRGDRIAVGLGPPAVRRSTSGKTPESLTILSN